MNRQTISKSRLKWAAAQPLFEGCTRHQLAAISNLGAPASVGARTCLMREGKAAFEFCLLVSGEVVCHVRGHEVSRLGPGDFFGEMSMLDGGFRHATVVASMPSEVVVYDRNEFVRLVQLAPHVAGRLVKAYADRRAVNASAGLALSMG